MLYSDVPIQKLEQDALNRKSFAQSLAKVIVEYAAPESFSIGLYGPWGSGKTSVMNMVLEAVEAASNDIITLRFNPWLCSDSKQLITQFFKQLASAIKLKEKTSDMLWRLIDNYSDILELTGDSGVGVLQQIAKILTRKAKARVANNENDLQKKKNEIIEHLEKEHVKILVAIDDIDRLSEKEIVAVFQLVKSLADFPNAMYLLAFDHDVVVKALEKVQQGSGQEYLEKIIQVPFALPEASAQSVQNILFSKLDRVIAGLPEEKWDKATWTELYQLGIKPYICSIRDVNRYTNVFSLKYMLMKDETDTVDLLGLTCLQVFEPAVYQLLPLYEKQLCGNDAQMYGYGFEEKCEKTKTAVDEILHVAKRRITAEKILEILFPNLQHSSWRGGRVYNHEQFMMHHNIAAPSCFTRYFALALDSDEIPSFVIENLMFRADLAEAESLIQSFIGNGKIKNLMRDLQAYCSQCEELQLAPERVEVIIPCLAHQLQTFDAGDDFQLFETPICKHFLWCINPLLEKLTVERRFTLLRSLFLDTDVCVYTLFLILRVFETEHNRFTDQLNEPQKSLITFEQLLDFEQLFVDRVCKELEQNKLLHCDGAMAVFGLFRRIMPELAEEKATQIVTDDLSLAHLIHQCIGHGGIIGRSVSKIWDANIESIAEYIDLDEAITRMTQFVQQPDFRALPQWEQEDIAAFFIGIEQRNLTDHALSESIDSNRIQKKLNQLLSKSL